MLSISQLNPVAKCIKGGSGLPALSLAPWCACRASQPELYHSKALKQNFFHFCQKPLDIPIPKCYNSIIKRKKEVNQMSIHDGLVLLAIYVGVIGAGALIEYVEHRVKRAVHRRKRS